MAIQNDKINENRKTHGSSSASPVNISSSSDESTPLVPKTALDSAHDELSHIRSINKSLLIELNEVKIAVNQANHAPKQSSTVPTEDLHQALQEVARLRSSIEAMRAEYRAATAAAAAVQAQMECSQLDQSRLSADLQRLCDAGAPQELIAEARTAIDQIKARQDRLESAVKVRSLRPPLIKAHDLDGT